MTQWYSCPKCGSPASNIKHEQDGETALFLCSNNGITSKAGFDCDGLIKVSDQEIETSKREYTEVLKQKFHDKIADEPCMS